VKSVGEIMEIWEAFDLTGSFRDAGELAGCSHHTVKHYVGLREAGAVAAVRPLLVDGFLPKLEEWMEHSGGKVRADVAHEKLLLLGFRGSERTTRRAVASVRAAFKAGRVRVHRPWVTEPGMWLLCRTLHNNHYADRGIMWSHAVPEGVVAGHGRCRALNRFA